MSQVTDQIDAVVAALWPGVVAQQAAYYAGSRAYYQMLWTHRNTPSAASPPDNLVARPTDQPSSPMSGLPPQMRSRMRIDTYGKPDGWVMTLETIIGGRLWQRSIDCGVDPTRSVVWREVVAPEVVP